MESIIKNTQIRKIDKYSKTPFAYIWKSIAQTVSIRKLAPNDEINKNEKVLYQRENFKIVVDDHLDGRYSQNMSCYPSSSKDDEDTKFIILYTFHGEYTDNYITGFIVYFLKEAKDICDKSIFMHVLCTFDWRDGKVYTFLYKQSLGFFQCHRDTHSAILNLHLLDYNDFLIGSNISYENDYQVSHINPIESCNRFLFIRIKKEEKVCCIDLGSLSFDRNNNGLLCDMYTLNVDKKKEFLQVAKTWKEQEYNDGYPLECIKCGSNTSDVTMYAKGIMIYLGKGFCETCLIRFSESGHKWECCRFKTEGYICCQPLGTKEYECNQNHNLDLIYKIDTNQSQKRPYRKQGSLYVTNFAKVSV